MENIKKAALSHSLISMDHIGGSAQRGWWQLWMFYFCKSTNQIINILCIPYEYHKTVLSKTEERPSGLLNQYCQAQPKIQLSWAEFSLNFEISSIRPPARPGLVPEKLPKKLKIDMEASFNPTRTNINKKKWGPPPAVISSQNSHFVTIRTRHLTKKLF